SRAYAVIPRRSSPFGPLVCCACLYCFSAQAQQQASSQEPRCVMDLPRPDYDAQRIALCGLMPLPSLSEATSYAGYAYRLPHEEKADWFFETTPIVRVDRKWDTTQLGFSANADNFTYTRLKHLGLTDWTIAANGQTALLPALAVTASAYYGEYHEGFESA